MKTLNEEYSSNIELCYHAMSLEFENTPEEVDAKYSEFKTRYEGIIRDHAYDDYARGKAQENLVQIEDIFDAIRHSLIYREHAAELAKIRAKQAAEKQLSLDKAAESHGMFKCHCCHRFLPKNTKKCMYCHEKVPTAFDHFMEKARRVGRIVVPATVVTGVLVGVIVGYQHYTIDPEALQLIAKLFN